MYQKLKYLILGTPIEYIIRFILRKPKITFTTSSEYWEKRYQHNGTSGSGSYGKLAIFKSEILNSIVSQYNIQSIIEFGCGDGNQLALIQYPQYTGFDISQKAIDICKKKFAQDKTKQFYPVHMYKKQQADLSISLDVIYHLIEDNIYEKYMHNLFASSTNLVIIYASNYNEVSCQAKHVKHRKFTDWVTKNADDFKQIEYIKNKYPYNKNNPNNTSVSDFYVFQRV